eukprot:gene8735-18054_t
MAGNVLYRNVKETDLKNVSILCANVFASASDTDTNLISYEDQYVDRFKNRVDQGLKHSMVLASVDDIVVGFVEVGMLPSPLRSVSGDVPYLGNLAVEPSFRRLGIGRRLVRIGLKTAEKWGESCLMAAVAQGNSAACQLYENMGFRLVLDEGDSIYQSVQTSGSSRLYFEKSWREEVTARSGIGKFFSIDIPHSTYYSSQVSSICREALSNPLRTSYCN